MRWRRPCRSTCQVDVRLDLGCRHPYAAFVDSRCIFVRMTPLSPLDALGPAFRRTREVMATPFRPGFFLKIALIAALTQPSFYSASISYPVQGAQFAALKGAGHRYSSDFGGAHLAAPPGLAAIGMIAFAVGALVLLAIWIVFAYLSCRLRFTLFDLVVSKRGLVGRAWSAYGRQSWRYFGLVILVSLAFMVVAVVLIGPTLVNAIRVVRPLAAAGPNGNPFPLLGAMLPMLAAIFVVGALWAVVDSLMQDFLLPPMAIEDAPLESAFSRFFTLLRSNFGPVAIYVLLRFAMGLALTWILMLAFGLILLAAGLAIFGIGTLLYHALWASLAGQVFCVALALLVGVIFLAAYFAGIVSIYGFSAVFKQSYAAYFFGGRYRELGERLEPPPAVIAELPSAPPAEPPSAPTGFPPLSDTPAVW